NKIELNLQTKWNDFEAKLRNSYVDTYKPLHRVPGMFKPELTESGHVEHVYKEQQATTPHHEPILKATSSNPSTENISSTTRKALDYLKEAQIGTKLTLNKSSVIKANVSSTFALPFNENCTQHFAFLSFYRILPACRTEISLPKGLTDF